MFKEANMTFQIQLKAIAVLLFISFEIQAEKSQRQDCEDAIKANKVLINSSKLDAQEISSINTRIDEFFANKWASNNTCAFLRADTSKLVKKAESLSQESIKQKPVVIEEGGNGGSVNKVVNSDLEACKKLIEKKKTELSQINGDPEIDYWKSRLAGDAHSDKYKCQSDLRTVTAAISSYNFNNPNNSEQTAVQVHAQTEMEAEVIEADTNQDDIGVEVIVEGGEGQNTQNDNSGVIEIPVEFADRHTELTEKANKFCLHEESECLERKSKAQEDLKNLNSQINAHNDKVASDAQAAERQAEADRIAAQKAEEDRITALQRAQDLEVRNTEDSIIECQGKIGELVDNFKDLAEQFKTENDATNEKLSIKYMTDASATSQGAADIDISSCNQEHGTLKGEYDRLIALLNSNRQQNHANLTNTEKMSYDKVKNSAHLCKYLETNQLINVGECKETASDPFVVNFQPKNSKMASSFKLAITPQAANQATTKITMSHLAPTEIPAEKTGLNFRETQAKSQVIADFTLNQENINIILNNIAGHKIATQFKRSFDALDDVEDPHYRGGTSTFNSCQRAVQAAGDAKWDDIYIDQELRKRAWQLKSEAVIFEYIDNMVKVDEEKNAFGYGNLIRNQGTASEGGIISKSFQKGISEAGTCEALANVIKDNVDEDRHKESDYISGGEDKSFDGRIECSVRSLEVMDFDECKLMINAHNAQAIAKKGLEVTQVVRTQEQSFEAQQKAQQASQAQMYGNVETDEDGSPKSAQLIAYELQRDGINKQKNLANERVTFHTATAATLTSLAANMPELDDIVKLCEVNGQKANSKGLFDDEGGVRKELSKSFDKFISVTGSEIKPESYDVLESCKSLAFNRVNNFIPNKEQTPNTYAIAAEQGVDAAKALVEAKAFQKQASLIDEMIKRVQGVDTDAIAEGVLTNNQLVKFCEANPSDSQCVGLGSGAASNVFNTGNVSFTGDGFGANTTEDFSETEADGNNVIEVDDTDTISSSDIPTATKKTKTNKRGSDGAIVAAAKKTKGGAAGGGSGGGGGVNPSAAGTQAGGPGAETQESSGLTAGADRYNAKYKGGSGGNFAARGGSGLRQRGSVKNPFKKLFNKGKGNQVLKFRSPASIGSKSGNLFTRISNRYDAVDSKNRLHKYQLQPKK